MAEINQITYSEERVADQAYNDMVDCPECYGLPPDIEEVEIKRLWKEGRHPATEDAIDRANDRLLDYLNDEFKRLSKEGFWVIQESYGDIVDDVYSATDVSEIFKTLPYRYSPNTLVLKWTDTDPVDATLEIDDGEYIAILVVDGNDEYHGLIFEALEDLDTSEKTELVYFMLEALEGELVDASPSMEDLERLPSRLIQRFFDQAAPFFDQKSLFEVEIRGGRPDIVNVLGPSAFDIKDFPASAKKTLKKILDEVEQLED